MKRTNRKKNPWADHYTRQAQKDNFAARSVYKLQEIQKKYRILKRGARILDLGCAPGSWLQFAAQTAGPDGRLVGIDLTPVTIGLPDHVTVITGDVADLEGYLVELGQTRFEAVISDMAPATTGNADFERVFRVQMNTLEAAVAFLPALWLAATYGSATWAGVIGLAWVAARIWYAVAYARDADRRGPAFGIGVLALLSLLVLAGVGLVRTAIG